MKRISRAHTVMTSLTIFTICTSLGGALGCGGADEGTPAPSGPAAGAGQPGGGDAPSTPPPSSSGSSAGDTAPPQVIKLSPAPAEAGVREDASIVFVFSEPMDADKTIAAYASSTLPPEKVKFTWNASGDQLTVTPMAPLAYAKGDPQVVANTFDARIGKGATDRAGNPLTAEAQTSFTTLRRVSTKISSTPSMTGTLTSAPAAQTGPVWVGENGSGVRFRGFFTFSLAALPSGVVKFESAMLSGVQASSSGSPDTDLGSLEVGQIAFDVFDTSLAAAKPTATAPVSLGLGINGSPPLRSANVTTMVADDYANRVARANRTQYRMAYQAITDGDAVADGFTLDGASLQIALVYLAP